MRLSPRNNSVRIIKLLSISLTMLLAAFFLNSCGGGGSSPEKLSPPFDEQLISYDLGGEEPLSVTTKRYSGSIELPPDINLQLDSLYIESGIAVETAVSGQGFFEAPMNSEATTLLTVLNENEDALLMNLFPKSEDIRNENPVINTESTAITLIAMQAGLITSEPNIDAIILEIISNIPELQDLITQIEEELVAGTFKINGGLSIAMLEKCVAVHEALATLSIPNALSFNFLQHMKYRLAKLYDHAVPNANAELEGFACLDSDTNNLYDFNGTDNDGVCLTGQINAPGEESSFHLSNKEGRWAALGVENFDGSLDVIDWVPARNISLPTISDLLTEILKLGYAEAKDFFGKIFKNQTNETSFMEKLTSAVSSYFGNGISDDTYIFQSAKSYDLAIVGASLKNYPPSDHEMTVFISGVGSTVTEVLGPWVAVLLEFSKTQLNNAVGDSISQKACQDRFVSYAQEAMPVLAEVSQTAVDEGFWQASKKFTNDFFLESLLSPTGDGVYVVSCLAKNIFNVAAIRAKVVDKVSKYALSGSVAFWVDVVDKGIAIFNATYSTGAFISTMLDEDVYFIDYYEVTVPGSYGPEAFPDLIDIVENSPPESGNVIVNDIPNDTSLSVLLIEIDGATYDVIAGGSITADTTLGGNLTIDSNGDYEYISGNVDHTITGGEPVEEVFPYTIINSYGQTASSTLTVVIYDSGTSEDLPANIILTANPINLPANGFSTSQVTALVRDANGDFVADGTPVTFAVNLGTISPSFAVTVDGLASVTFTAGEIPGSIDILAAAGGADSGTSGSALINLVPVFTEF